MPVKKTQLSTNPLANYAPLKAYLKTSNSPNVLLPYLERWMLKRPAEYRSQKDLHPSAMSASDWCDLAGYLALKGFKPNIEEITFSKYNMFQEGHSIHAKWQRYLQECGVLWGVWELPDGTREVGTSTSEHDTYHEVSLVHPTLPLQGHADGLLVGVDPAKDYLLEIKSMGAGTFRYYDYGSLADVDNDLEAAWKALRSPFLAHKTQVNIYMGIANDMAVAGTWDRPLSPPTSCVVIYENKANQEIKEFSVGFAPVAWNIMRERVVTISRALNGAVPPPKCPNGGTQGCKHCNAFEDRS